MNASSLFPRRSFWHWRGNLNPSCVCEQLVQTAPTGAAGCLCGTMWRSPHRTLHFLPGSTWTSFSGVTGWHTDFWRCVVICLPHAGKIPYDVHSDREIFRDTMGCFSRFCGRPKPVPAGSYLTVPFGHGGTSRAACSGWVRWNLNTEQPARMSPSHPVLARHPVLSVHISSDARLSDDALPGSYGQADEFFALHGPALCKSGMPRAVLCGTWLLSPALRALLSPDSGISVLAGIIASMQPTLTKRIFLSLAVRRQKPPYSASQANPAYETVAARLEPGGYIQVSYGIKK